MKFTEALKLKNNMNVYVKGTNEVLRVDSISVNEAEKAVWVIGFENGGLKKRHHKTLMLNPKQ